MFPPKFEPTPTSKQPSAVVRPVSPFGGHCCSGVSKPVLADGGSSWSRSGSIVPSSFFSISTRTHSSNDGPGVGERGLRYCAVSIGETVPCAASRSRFSMNRLSLAESSSEKLTVPCSIP
ncbi:unnamed protein product [Ascophyllum nodosum]